MKKLLSFLLPLLLVAAAMLAPPAQAQASIEYKALVDTEGRSLLVTSTKLAPLTNVFGRKGWSVDTYLLGGVDAFGVPVAGVAATSKVKIADQLTLELGPAYRTFQGQRPKFGLFFGLALKS